MKEKNIDINIGQRRVNILAKDDGKYFSVSVIYRDYYIPPTYSYNYTDFNNHINSQESGLFYGNLEDVMKDFIKVIETDPKILDKLNSIDNYINNK
jgi:hypothetical protein